MVNWILKKILGSKNQREIKRLRPMAHRINELDEQFKSLSDDELRAKTAAWKQELAAITDPEERWNKLDEILPEAFAVVKNAARRLTERQHNFSVCDQPMTWNMVHFDVQLIGGIVLHRARIAEMATGEGKTLVATLPLYLNALTGRGAHLVTVNDYLARRDAEWMGAALQISRPDRGLHSARSTAGCTPRAIRDGYHIWNEQRVRFRLSARQRHGHDARAAGPARLQFRDRRRSRFHPDRRSAHAVDHQRTGDGFDPSVRQMEAAHRTARAQAEHALQPAGQRSEGAVRARTSSRRRRPRSCSRSSSVSRATNSSSA